MITGLPKVFMIKLGLKSGLVPFNQLIKRRLKT